MERPIIQTGVWRHWKGNLYLVLGIRDRRDLEEDEKSLVSEQFCVLYRNHITNAVYVRNYTEFVGNVQHEGKTVPRFTYVGS
jgi:hypothetical protein